MAAERVPEPLIKRRVGGLQLNIFNGHNFSTVDAMSNDFLKETFQIFV